MARLKDPMTRYLISMLIDRLTEQIVMLLQAQDLSDVSSGDRKARMN